MTSFRLGINTCFAVKRWPQPQRWAAVVRDDLGLDLVQHSFDLVDLDAAGADVAGQAAGCGQPAPPPGLSCIQPSPASPLTRRICCCTRTPPPGTGPGPGTAAPSTSPPPPARPQPAAMSAPTASMTGATRCADPPCGQSLPSRWADWPVTRGRPGLSASWPRISPPRASPPPSDQLSSLLTEGDTAHVPIRLCLDVGHQCVPGTTGRDRDPYAWLKSSARRHQSFSCSRPTARPTITGRSRRRPARTASSTRSGCSPRSTGRARPRSHWCWRSSRRSSRTTTRRSPTCANRPRTGARH